MTRKPDTPCTVCGILLWRSLTPASQRVCRPCAAAAKPEPTPRMPRLVGRVCEICGERYRRSYSAQRTCGRTCGAKLNVREHPPRAPKPTAEPVVHQLNCEQCGKSFESPRRKRFCASGCAKTAGNRRRGADHSARQCKRCQKSFASTPDTRGRRALFCSKVCTKRHARATAPSYRARNHQSRARHFGVTYESFPLSYIFQRDGWRCGICRKAINPKLKFPHPMSKSIDHIVPFARGGGHTKDNVQAAHLQCNSLKQDNTTERGEQLMLFG